MRHASVLITIAMLAAAGCNKSSDGSNSSASPGAKEAEPSLPDLKLDVDALDSVQIGPPGKPEVRLERKGGTWQVTAPVTGTANVISVRSLLSNLGELKAKEIVIPRPDPESLKQHDFVPEKQLHVVASSGGKKVLDVTFGKSGALAARQQSSRGAPRSSASRATPATCTIALGPRGSGRPR